MVRDNNDAALIFNVLKETRILRDDEPTENQLTVLLHNLPESFCIIGDKSNESV
jgi:hypothetical protein